MSYDLPTDQQFKARFPIFADTDDDVVSAMIVEASGSVDKTWVEHDYQPAIMYLAAHLLATDNSADGEMVEIGAAGGGTVASESFGGGLSVSYASPVTNSQSSLSSDDEFGTTVYGRRYLALLNRNRGGPLVV